MILLNDEEIKAAIFPDGTSQVWQISDSLLDKFGTIAVIEWRFGNEAEFMHLAQLKMLLDSYGKQTSLLIDYLPYGRQDKRVANNQTFALYTFAELLNSLNFKAVSILDPHSMEAERLIYNSTAFYKTSTIAEVVNMLGSDIICYPDDGAQSKYERLLASKILIDNTHAYKKRNQSTGEILEYVLSDPNAVKNKYVLIVDDICDGGQTFVKLAKLLQDAGAKEINLFVTHGLFTKGLKPLKDAGINRIFSKTGEAVQVDGHTVGHKI